MQQEKKYPVRPHRSLILCAAVGLAVAGILGSPLYAGKGSGSGMGSGRGGVADGSSSGGGKRGSQVQLPATLDDFFIPGTQEGTLIDPMINPFNCRFCHEFEYDGNKEHVVAPFDNWVTSMMGQAARDPIWHAALAIANQDVNLGGESCIRCHSPHAWLEGRSVPTDASAFVGADWDGVSCNFCHRLVDPVASPNNPPEDEPILAALVADGLLPAYPGNASYVVDPYDTRRGPRPYCGDDPGPDCPPDAVPANFHGVPIITSSFHTSSAMCGTCHDVSNPVYTRQSDGTYALNAFGAAHPTLNPYDMMPEQRTYSEWRNSAFANGGVHFGDGRFGGDHPTGVMESCQDCHMPKRYGGACNFWFEPPFFARPDVAEHSFVGANTWVLAAVHELYGTADSNLTPENVQLARSRTENMLRAASDMQLAQMADTLKVRVINYSGHKLPTGYPEGRRMWLNVQFLDENDQVIDERGAYDFSTATLTASDTKVYEMKLGIDETVAAATGLNAGPTFHLLLNNVVLKDNRIPPIGFTNDAFEAIQAAPVNYVYEDGQYWDDTLYNIPYGAARAVVTLYYQTTSKEYIEFLRDTNTTNNAGQVAYDLWLSNGMSAPVDMDVQVIDLSEPRLGDVTGDGVVDMNDLLAVISAWGQCAPPTICTADVNDDGAVNVDDLLLVISNWG